MSMDKGVAKNSMWMMLGKILQIIVGLIIGMFTARYLGPSDYGLINYSSSYVSFFTPIYTLGLSSILVNELIKRPNKKGEVLGSAIILRLIGSVVSSVLIILWIYCIHPDDTMLLIVAGLQCISIFFQWCELFNYWCQSELNSKVSVFVQLVAYLITSVYKIWLLATGKSVIWFAFSISFDFILQAAFYLFYFTKKTGQKCSFNLITAKELFASSYHYIFSALGAVLYAQTDKLMLGWFFNTEEVGVYTAAVTISTMWTFVLSAFIDSCRPIIIQTRAADQEEYKKKIIRLYSAIIYTSTIVCFCMCVASNLIIYILYGQDYIAAAPVLCIVAWSTLFSFLGVARSIWCVAESKQKYEKYLTFGGAFVNVALNLLLIPTHGVIGAAIATLVTQFVSNVLILLLIKDMKENAIFILRALNPTYCKEFFFEFYIRGKK